MEWKIYEEWLDITLYRQMTNLIYKLSSNEEKYKIYMQLKEKFVFDDFTKQYLGNYFIYYFSNYYTILF